MKLMLLMLALLRFAPGPIRNPLRRTKPVGSVFGVPVIPNERTPPKSTPSKSVSETFVFIRPIEKTPTSCRLSPERLESIRLEELSKAPEILRPRKSTPVMLSPDKFAVGPIRRPFCIVQSSGNAFGVPTIELPNTSVSVASVRFVLVKFTEVILA